jgi:predicted dehydrogenase
MLRVGIIGLGAHGRRYVKHVMDDVPDMRLVAVCRRDRVEGERVASAAGVRFVQDAAELIAAPDVDAVIIVTPPPSHLPLARAALEAGKPVVLEKPLTHTLAEARELARVVERTRVPLLLAQTLRYNVALQVARDALPRIGPLRSVTASQRLPKTGLEWQNAPAGAPLGAVLNTGVHLFDLVRWMLGAELASVFCTARCIENPHHEDVFKVQATLRGSDVLVALEVAKATQSRSSNLELVGEHGQLWVDYQTDAVTLVAGNQRTTLREPGVVYTIPLLLQDFARRVASAKSMPITARDGVRTLEVVDACYRSATSGRVEAAAIDADA